MMREPIFPTNLLLLLLFFSISFAIDDTLTPSHPLSNGEILVSKNKIYALGFFAPSDSILLSYLGIWYYNRNRAKDKILWVANRVDPIPHINATVLKLTADNASLQITTTNNSSVIWSSPSFPNSVPNNPIAQLLDTGNFVIRAPNSTSYLWQSFDHPTNTLLPGMKLGPDMKTGVDLNLTASGELLLLQRVWRWQFYTDNRSNRDGRHIQMESNIGAYRVGNAGGQLQLLFRVRNQRHLQLDQLADMPLSRRV